MPYIFWGGLKFILIFYFAFISPSSASPVALLASWAGGEERRGDPSSSAAAGGMGSEPCFTAFILS